MRKLVRKGLGFILTMGLVINTYGTYVYVSAESINTADTVICGETNALNLRNNSDEEDSILLEKLEYDKDNHMTELPKDIEEELNEVGLFDNEIEQLDDDTIENIENSVYTEASVIYYKEADENGEKVEMTEDEVEELIEEKIDSGEMEYEEEDTSLLSKALTAVGILPTNVSAKTKTQADTDISPSGALKSYMIVSQTKKGGKIYVTYTATWLKEAKNRGKDVIGVSMTNAAYDKGSMKCDHWATYEYTNTNGWYSHHTETKHTQPTTKKTKDAGFAYTVNLFGNRSSMNACLNAGVIEHYNNEFISIRFTCDPLNKNAKYTIFASSYNHWESNVSVTPSISISSGGSISVGVSGGKNNYYRDIDGNAYIKYKYI